MLFFHFCSPSSPLINDFNCHLIFFLLSELLVEDIQIFFLHSSLYFGLFSSIEHVRTLVLFSLHVLILEGVALDFRSKFIFAIFFWRLFFFRLLRLFAKPSKILLLISWIRCILTFFNFAFFRGLACSPGSICWWWLALLTLLWRLLTLFWFLFLELEFRHLRVCHLGSLLLLFRFNERSNIQYFSLVFVKSPGGNIKLFMCSPPPFFEWQYSSGNSLGRQLIYEAFLTLNNFFLLRLNPIPHLLSNLIPNLALVPPLHNKSLLLLGPFECLL